LELKELTNLDPFNPEAGVKKFNPGVGVKKLKPCSQLQIFQIDQIDTVFNIASLGGQKWPAGLLLPFIDVYFVLLPLLPK